MARFDPFAPGGVIDKAVTAWEGVLSKVAPAAPEPEVKKAVKPVKPVMFTGDLPALELERWLASTLPELAGNKMPQMELATAYTAAPTAAHGDRLAYPEAAQPEYRTAQPDYRTSYGDPLTKAVAARQAAPSGRQAWGWNDDPLTQAISRRSAQPQSAPAAATAPAPAQATQLSWSSSPTALEQAIDKYAGDDRDLALAMRVGALLEGGSLTGPWASGDQGQSHGPYQIYQGAHAGRISVQDSLDPDAATRYMLADYRAGVNRVRSEYPGLFQSDPYKAAALAAFYAERPAAMYPEQRIAYARSVLQNRSQVPATGASLAFGAAINEASRYLGTPYVYGGSSPQTGFDCSGLVQWSYRQAGIQLPRTAQQQWESTVRIPEQAAQAGDLVFFHSTYNAGTPITHVGIYLGNGQMLSAVNDGVRIVSLNQPYWQQHFAGFGRVVRR
jgi:cell wall-associated NlpC family hydrolase